MRTANDLPPLSIPNFAVGVFKVRVNLWAMPEIVLATLNAKYIHASFGLRYLFANLGELQPRAAIVEFDINQRPLELAEVLLARAPKIIGLGVYIWNVSETTEVVAILKRVRPEIKIILGGPEVSFETEGQEIVRLADHVITGEADLKFAEVCQELLRDKPLAMRGIEGLPKIIPAGLPDFSRLMLPYEWYTDADLAHRIVYVEASRGCPFTCEFCLSSLDIPVRAVPLEPFLGAMQKLLDRGLKQFKFVDRTFNLNVATSRTVLEFFLARHRPGNFYHFEMIPDRLPAELREVIAQFPPGSLQFEVGVQTFNPEVGRHISRRQDYQRLADNFAFLRQSTRVHLHADLIVGLPGETVESFASGFDRLVALGPQEIQVGILKRLRGTPIIRHDAEWQMVYNAQPPYEILQNRMIDFALMQRLRRFAKFWDLVGNSGNFVGTVPLIWGQASPFTHFLRLSDWLYSRLGRTDTIALARLAEALFDFLTGEMNWDMAVVAKVMAEDWQRVGRRAAPEFLRGFLGAENGRQARGDKASSLKRQARHLAE
jgi:radical SAM superfamily enzyme YgiQ (UPF0313 family)